MANQSTYTMEEDEDDLTRSFSTPLSYLSPAF